METPEKQPIEYQEMTVEKADLMDTINEQAKDGWQVARTHEYAGRKPSKTKLFGIPLSWMPATFVQVFFVRGQDGAQPWTATKQPGGRVWVGGVVGNLDDLF